MKKWGRTTNGGWSKVTETGTELRIVPTTKGCVMFGVWVDGAFVSWDWERDEERAKRRLKGAGY